MLNRIDNLHVRPLFYDALSGEFRPPSDLQKRAHTLGRLAYAGYSKGQISLGECISPVYSSHSAFYRPSWASMVEVEVAVRIDNESNDRLLRSLTLRADNGPSISVVSLALPDSYDTWLEIVKMDGSSRDGLLDLGENLNRSRDLVTTQAQEFFDTVA